MLNSPSSTMFRATGNGIAARQYRWLYDFDQPEQRTRIGFPAE